MKGQLLRRFVEDGVHGLDAPVARLADRADGGQPMPVARHRNRHARRRRKRHQLAGAAAKVQRLKMHVAAEHIAHVGVAHRRLAGGVQAQGGELRVLDIAPAGGRVGAGVHQQRAAVDGGQRQRGQKGALVFAELLLRPGHAGVAQAFAVAHRLRGVQVVVALNDDGALRRKRHHALHHVRRVGAITHQVAQKGMALGAGRFGVSQAGVQRLPIGVDVGQQGELHGGAQVGGEKSMIRAPPARWRRAGGPSNR